jgi:CheY-like chemotaxis protein
MDIQMPVMDGFEATRTIRQMFPDKRIPIIALSANAFDEDRRKSFEAGMDGHLAKPIVIAQLEDALKKYLKK